MLELFSMGQVEAWGAANNEGTRNMLYILNLHAEFWGPLPIQAMKMFIHTANTKIRQLEAHASELEAHASQLEAHAVQVSENGELIREIKELKSKIGELESSETEPTQAHTKRKLESMGNSYNAKCHEMDILSQESVRKSILNSVSMHEWSAEKKELVRQIKELNEKLISESLQASIIRDLEQNSTRQATKLSVALSSLDRYDRENTTCPVPARGGWLISLKRVYHSWETEGIDTVVTEERLPAFKEPETGKSMELVSLDLINLFHLIMHDFGIPNDLPFKLQYKNEDDGEWRDIMFSDQIRIASTMFQMKQNHPTKPSTANRLVHSNMLLVSIIMDEAKAFKYEIRYSNDLSKTIPSQMI